MSRDRMYDMEFGDIPNDYKERIEYIIGDRNPDKIHKAVSDAIKEFEGIKWNELKLVLWKTIKPAARPRITVRGGFSRIYVPRAKEYGDWFEKYAKEHNLPKIDTPCKLNLKIYEKTPASFNIKKKILAEYGFIRPWKRTGDFDNYAKSISDFIQHGLLKDDCLIIESNIQLLYSIKPHTEIEIQWLDKFPN